LRRLAPELECRCLDDNGRLFGGQALQGAPICWFLSPSLGVLQEMVLEHDGCGVDCASRLASGLSDLSAWLCEGAPLCFETSRVGRADVAGWRGRHPVGRLLAELPSEDREGAVGVMDAVFLDVCARSRVGKAMWELGRRLSELSSAWATGGS
jgi:hypothetical protein